METTTDVVCALADTLENLAYVGDLDSALAGKIEQVQSVQAAGYLTMDAGLEVTFTNGRKFLLMIQKVG